MLAIIQLSKVYKKPVRLKVMFFKMKLPKYHGLFSWLG